MRYRRRVSAEEVVGSINNAIRATPAASQAPVSPSSREPAMAAMPSIDRISRALCSLLSRR
ncbi:hypothetical protein [Accumulibacter sp.]|uniref:hypothetical protein n=1 Tax=Accumulibacter sp. TaxID=2053492 RepID=UPI00258DBE3A|nr:hypothetical protein [Accumulibacter sp.]